MVCMFSVSNTINGYRIACNLFHLVSFKTLKLLEKPTYLPQLLIILLLIFKHSSPVSSCGYSSLFWCHFRPYMRQNQINLRVTTDIQVLNRHKECWSCVVKDIWLPHQTPRFPWWALIKTNWVWEWETSNSWQIQWVQFCNDDVSTLCCFNRTPVMSFFFWQ